MNILAIETATEACSAALLMQDETGLENQKIYVRFQHAPREHTKLILPMLDAVLDEAKLSLGRVDAIAFGRGPGAFTGLRIAAGVAQGVALSVDIPVIPVSSLMALAQMSLLKIDDEASIIVALDARMNEVYWGEYELKQGEITLIGEEQVTPPDLMLEQVNPERKILAVGNGWEVYFSDLPQNIHLLSEQYPSAEYIAQLALPLLQSGNVKTVEQAQPVYIRNNVAKKKAQQ